MFANRIVFYHHFHSSQLKKHFRNNLKRCQLSGLPKTGHIRLGSEPSCSTSGFLKEELKELDKNAKSQKIKLKIAVFQSCKEVLKQSFSLFINTECHHLYHSYTILYFVEFTSWHDTERK